MADYPSSVTSFAVLVDGVDYVLAAHQNDRADEIVAIQTELGTDPAGNYSDVKTRLNALVVRYTGKTAAPTVNDDNTQGYGVSDQWIDETNDKIYQCVDSSTGAAVWIDITQTGGGTASPAFKNLTVNGAMKISQRGTSESSVSTSGYKGAPDHYDLALSSLGTWTVSQWTGTSLADEGFHNAYGILCTTANASPAAGALFILRSKMEGINLQHLKKGTANAESLTVSFYVFCSVTGTFIVSLNDNDNGRTISATYTVDVANTWEKKTVTFAGDTTGSMDNDTGLSLLLDFWLGAGTDFTSGTLATSWESTVAANIAVGQTNLASAVSNAFYITGIQLEVGDTATDFEHLPYDVDLTRCLRYCYNLAVGDNIPLGFGHYNGGSTAELLVDFPVEMLTTPTLSASSGTGYYVLRAAAADDAVNSLAILLASSKSAILYNNTEASGTSGYSGRWRTANASASVIFNAEL